TIEQSTRTADDPKRTMLPYRFRSCSTAETARRPLLLRTSFGGCLVSLTCAHPAPHLRREPAPAKLQEPSQERCPSPIAWFLSSSRENPPHSTLRGLLRVNGAETLSRIPPRLPTQLTRRGRLECATPLLDQSQDRGPLHDH